MGKSSRRKKKKRTQISALQVFLPFLVLALIGSAALFFADIFGVASSVRNLITARQVEVIDEFGIRQITGDYTIDEPDQLLEDACISGNLYLGAGIGDGSVNLLNVSVAGSVLVQGGGLNTVYIRNCSLKKIKLNRPDGEVRIIVSGDTTVDIAVVETGGRLLDNPAPGFEGFKVVDIMTTEELKLNGSFEKVVFNVPGAKVEMHNAEIGKLFINRQAAGAMVVFPTTAKIQNLYLDGSAYLSGDSIIENAYLSAPGIAELEGSFNQAKIAAEAGQYRMLAGTAIAGLTVEKEALNNSLQMEVDTLISELTLSEATEVKGEGVIEKLFVNAAGSTLEQIPGEIVFSGNFVVTIAGHEITTPDMLAALIKHGDPLYAGSSAGRQGTPAPAPKPAPAPAPEPAPAPAPVPEPKPAPDPVSEFIVEEGLTPGKKLVIVTLSVPDPQNYTVRVGGTALGYNYDARRFWGEIESSLAERKNVEVIR